MAQKNARELAIKRETSPGSGVFSYVCGFRTRTFKMSNAQIDTTVPNCTDPSLPIIATAMPGRQTIEFSGDGLFDNDTASVAVFEDSRVQSSDVVYRVIIPGVGSFEGPFFISEYELGGEMEDAMGFSATWVPLDNSQLTFTAE